MNYLSTYFWLNLAFIGVKALIVNQGSYPPASMICPSLRQKLLDKLSAPLSISSTTCRELNSNPTPPIQHDGHGTFNTRVCTGSSPASPRNQQILIGSFGIDGAASQIRRQCEHAAAAAFDRLSTLLDDPSLRPRIDFINSLHCTSGT